MSFYVSPGVYVRERDISAIVPNLATTIGGLVGYSKRGDIDDIQLITNTQQFIDEYGKPEAGDYFHYAALAFLENGNKLYCLRVVNGALYGGIKIMESASGDSNEALTTGVSAPAFTTVSGEDILFYIFAKDPGAWNDKIGIKITNLDAVNYEFDIEVYMEDDDGNDIQMESWTVSRKTKLDGYGKQMYLETKINGYSKYIVVEDSTTVDTTMPKEQATVLNTDGGDDGSAATSSEINTGWDSFANPDDVDVRILIEEGYASTATAAAVQGKMKTIAEARKDCIAVLSIPSEAIGSVANMVTYRDTTQNFNSSYCAIYAPWVKIYDQYTDSVLEVPPAGYAASMMAYNDYVADPWYAPAGAKRGLLNILGVTDVFTSGERDTLYAAEINPVQTFRGEGSMIWGQKTERTTKSALDRVNVRRLLITIEKAMSVYLREYLFEPNNEITRFRVTSVLEQYLDNISARGGFQTEAGDKGFSVVCDETNNTPQTIDLNELHVDVFIKPIRMAEFIQLQAIITTTGASFNELIARGVMF